MTGVKTVVELPQVSGWRRVVRRLSYVGIVLVTAGAVDVVVTVVVVCVVVVVKVVTSTWSMA